MSPDLSELTAIALRHARGLQSATPIPRLHLNLGREPTELRPGIFEPAACLVLQGAKEVVLGDRRIHYGEGCYIVASVELAVCGRIVEASRERPYVSVALALDREALSALLPTAPVPTRADGDGGAYGVNPATPEMADAWLRLVRLLERPQDIPVLGPMLEREILYRLLQSPQAEALRQIALVDSRASRVRQAIAWIRIHYDQRLRVDALAEIAGMSPASFHRHFRALTTMSPLQFQKSLRLQQARQLLLAEHDAARAGFAVGYGSASQFSREYARLFGAPPARDAQRLRADPGALAELAAAEA